MPIRPIARACSTLLIVCLAGAVTAGCATHQSSNTFRVPEAPLEQATKDETRPSSLAAYITQLRAAVANTPPPKRNTPQSVETWDPQLRAALVALAQNASGKHLREVAQSYGRLRIFDAAHRYYTRAIALDSRDAAAYDGRARLWRDFGFPGFGIGDAYRAIYFAPDSPAARNTLGTLLEARGDLQLARAEYQRALVMKPDASFALINLCHVDTRLRSDDALTTCESAVDRSPDSKVARNNLALALASAGDFAKAKDSFMAAGDPATAAYNMGIVYMAWSQFDLAAESFRKAWNYDPGLSLAAHRLRQIAGIQAR